MKMFISLISIMLLFSVAQASKFEVGASFGYGSTTQVYDSTGKAQDLGGTFSLLNLGLSGKYYVLSPEIGPKVYLGGKFKLSQHQFSPKQGESSSSGFAPQYIAILVGANYLFVNGKLGFQLDLGPEAKEDKIINSDRQNAILIGLGANVPFMAGLGDFHANFDYAFTLEKTEDNVTYDMGDNIILTFGGGYKFALSEVVSIRFGLDIIYRIITAEKMKVGNTTVEGEGGNNLSIMPYFNYKTGPLGLWLKLGYSDEYGYYGISIMGKNSFVSRLGVSAGLKFSY